MGQTLQVGLGFATGRRSFQGVLRTYINDWGESLESGHHKNVALHLLVAYDLAYNHTAAADYAITDGEVIRALASVKLISVSSMKREARKLVRRKVLSQEEAALLFGEGYSAKRNAILYEAVKARLDYLIFLDDDEYPLAVVRIGDRDFWTRQPVIASHIKYLSEADVTHGLHCGYVSPIPQFKWNDQFSKEDFRLFIEAISNDILDWDSIQEILETRGVTYADLSVIQRATHAEEVPEIDGAKFISGANLGLSLKSTSRVIGPFYNPPGARGEDTFLSTCLSEHKVVKIPTYAFHDGFSRYEHVLRGVLPSALRAMPSHGPGIEERFFKACVGWIRYKPLLTYVINREGYEAEIDAIRARLSATIPLLCAYFGTDRFNRISAELEDYHCHVGEHFKEFEDSRAAWAKLMATMDD